MVLSIEASEVDEFSTSVPGLEVEYIRTDAGHGPCRMVSAGSDDVTFSAGSMGFSAIAGTETPSDTAVFALITTASEGSRFCGVELQAGQLFCYAPGTTFSAVEPAGLAATMLTVRTRVVERATDHLGDPLFPRSIDFLEPSQSVEDLKYLLLAATADPASADEAHWSNQMLDAVAAVVAAPGRWGGARRRLDSRAIVAGAIDFVESTQTVQPAIWELCRAVGVSESRLRQAFMEVLDAPPTQYFQYRLLSRLRSELVAADPVDDTVTEIAGSLGVTQFGRVAGRYRRAFDEVPSETLRRRPERQDSP